MSDQEEVRQLEDAIQRIWTDEEQKGTFQLPQTAADLHAVTPKPQLKCRRILRGHFGKIYAMAWNPSDPRLLVSASQDGKLIVWNGMTNLKMAAISLKSTWVMACGYSPRGTLLASGGLDNLCSLYRLQPDAVANGGQLYAARGSDDNPGPAVVLEGHEGYLSSCKFVDEGQIITTSGDSYIKLWDIEHSRATQTMAGHTLDVMGLSIHEDGRIIVTGSCDASSKVWDTRMGTCTNTFPRHESDVNSVAWFPGQLAFASGSDDSMIYLNDLRSYRTLNMYGNQMILAGCTSLDFTHTGTHIVAAYDVVAENGSIVWDTLTGRQALSLPGHTGRVSCVGISPDGKALATGSWDQMLRIWA